MAFHPLVRNAKMKATRALTFETFMNWKEWNWELCNLGLDDVLWPVELELGDVSHEWSSPSAVNFVDVFQVAWNGIWIDSILTSSTDNCSIRR